MNRGRYALLAVAAVFLAVNLVTASRYPSAWVDEVQFTDPAANLALGHGFTSSVWIVQDSTAFWAGNAPLYSTVLSGWLRLFGFSPLAVRSFNYFLTVLLAILFWEFLERRLHVRQTRWKLMAVALILCGHCIMFSFRMGRYDVMGMVIAVLAALAWSPSPSIYRAGALVLLGAAMPIAGLQLIPGALLFVMVITLFRRQEALRPGLALLGGLVAGGLTLFLLFWSHGVWQAFRASTSAVGVIGQSIVSKIAQLPRIYTADKSGLLLLAAAALLLIAGRRHLMKWQSSPLVFSVAFALLVPAALQCAAKYPLYYNWMVYLPLIAALAAYCDSEWDGVTRSLRIAVVALVAVACLAGLPVRLVTIAANWTERDPAKLDSFVESSLSPADSAVVDFKAYYPAKRTATSIFTPTYLGVMTPAEKRGITALLIRPDGLPAAIASIGGDWAVTGEAMPSPSTRIPPFLGMQEFRDENYEVRLYRRRSP